MTTLAWSAAAQLNAALCKRYAPVCQDALHQLRATSVTTRAPIGFGQVKMDNFKAAAKRKEFERFEKAIGAEIDPTMRVLRAHLFSENLMERLLIAKLPRGDKVIENGNLTFHQKLVLIESLDFLPDSITSALRSLNKLRNACAHELDKKITESDITKIGSPLGKTFTEHKRSSNFDEARLLHHVVASICGHLAGACVKVEHPEVATPAPSDDEPKAA